MSELEKSQAEKMEQNQNASIDELEAYYGALPKECGYASQCQMALLGNLRGKRVLDIDCRRGKGVIKLSAAVDATGSVIGVDPSPEWIELANSFVEESWRRNGLPHNNMEYRRAYPEDLAAAGLIDSAFDLVFANSSINIDYCPAKVISEIYRVLRPGGIFVYDGVIADSARDASVAEQARAIGNSIQAALSRSEFERLLTQVGFDLPEYHDSFEVRADTGYKDDFEVPVVDTTEDVRFIKTTARIYKPRSR